MNTTLQTPIVGRVSRRGFIAGSGGFALAVGWPSGDVHAQDKPPKYGADGMANGWVDNPLVFVAIAPDGIVTITCHRAEMGQGVRTGMPLIVADELEADWSKVRVVQAPGDEARFGNQDTDGSRSTRHFFMPLRRCGAAARSMLEAAAAARWGVAASEVTAVKHELIHQASGRKLGFGEVAADAAKLPVPKSDALRLKTPAQFRYIGKEKTQLIDGLAMTTGRAVYGQDVVLPDMLYAVIARSPVFGATLKSFDATAALKVPGVVKVVEIKGSPLPVAYAPLPGVAVVANNTWAAMKGREALTLDWDGGPNADYDSTAYRSTMQAAGNNPGKVIRNTGDVDAAMRSAAKTLKADYYIPHLTQAAMEPPAATARVADGKCEVWGCFQSPQAVRKDVAKRLGLDAANVTVNVTLLGGGFGRKSKGDFATEAALVAKETGGKPVKVVWTREDDLRHSYYHTVSLEHLEAALDAGGKPTAWLHRSVGPTLMALFMPDPKVESAIEIGMGLANVPFVVPNLRVENPEAAAHVRIGWYRSVSNIPHAFAVHSFVDELARAAGRDPLEFMLELLGPPRQIDPRELNDKWNHGEDPALYPLDVGRLRRVATTAATAAGWGKALPNGGKGRGRGIAAHYSFVTYVAAVVEVAIDAKGQLSIPRVDMAVDCGAVVNPDRVRSQMEGACIMGLSNALHGEISFKDGRVVQGNFNDFELMRMHAAPKAIHVHIIGGDYDKPLGGVGEPGVPPIAPALGNAIFAATGKRLRELPMRERWKA
jgi:isoquinoline 1-oxidoreductase subunit beta